MTPTGSVTFATDGPGSFSAPTCTLSGTGASASCQVTYIPSPPIGSIQTITVGYDGDSTHTVSSTHTTLPVTIRATGTSVSCDAAGAMVGRPTVCTVTVTDRYG